MQTSRYLERAVGGDAAALDELARRMRPVLETMARHKLPPALRTTYGEEDLIQDVWVIVLRNLGSIRPRDGRRTPVLVRYLRTTMERHVATVLRREIYRTVRRENVDSDVLDQLDHGGRRTISVAAARELGAAVADSIDALEEPVRTIVYQRGIEQRPNHEVAARLGMLPNTVAKTYRRALAIMARKWPESVFAEL